MTMKIDKRLALEWVAEERGPKTDYFAGREVPSISSEVLRGLVEEGLVTGCGWESSPYKITTTGREALEVMADGLIVRFRKIFWKN